MNDSGTRRRKLVVVGGGYGGTRLARGLDKDMDVVLVERRDRFVHNIGAIRAVTDPSWLDAIILPYSGLLERGQIVHDEVTGVRSGSVTLRDAGELAADYIVLAVGSSYPEPFKAGALTAHFAATMHEINARLRTSQSVAIVGAGPVGIELAGEIAAAYPDKAVTLVSSGSQLLPTYTHALGRSLRRQLEELGVHVLTDRRALDLASKDSPFGPATVQLDDGSEITADLVFPVIGSSPSTEFLLASGVGLNKARIIVDSQLAVPGFRGVWALGDAADTGEPMTVVSLERQVPYLIKHLRTRHLADETEYTAAPYRGWPHPPIVVPLGVKHGASQLPPRFLVGAWITSLLKGRNLLVNKAAKSLGVSKKRARNQLTRMRTYT